jgi:hypothetical protein
VTHVGKNPRRPVTSDRRFRCEKWVEWESREAPETSTPDWERGRLPGDASSAHPRRGDDHDQQLAAPRRDPCLAAWAWLAGGSAASAAERSVKDWEFEGTDKNVKDGTAYTLYNVHEKQSVKYGERKWGINLVWDKGQGLNNIKVVSEAKGNGVIKYGHKVAIHVEKGGYLKYQKQDWGINLVWSKTPVYEFVIPGGTKGTLVPTNAAVGLYNMVEKDFLINAERPVGINLR